MRWSSLGVVLAIALVGCGARRAPATGPVTTTRWESVDAVRQISVTLNEGPAPTATFAVRSTMGGEQEPFTVALEDFDGVLVANEAGCRITLGQAGGGLIVGATAGCPKEREVGGVYRPVR